MAPHALPRMGRASPRSTGMCRSPGSSPLTRQPCTPGRQRKRRAAWRERCLAAAPLRLGRHVRASQSRLQVGIHHGLAVRRLNVVGGFLELQQHGHLWGKEHGTKPKGDERSTDALREAKATWPSMPSHINQPPQAAP